MHKVPLHFVLWPILILAVQAQAVTQYTIQAVPILGGSSSGLDDISNSGVAVGYTQIGGALSRPILFQNGNMTVLPLLPGAFGGTATCINGQNAIAGYSSGSIARACTWPNGVVVDQGTLLGGTDSQIFGINSAGVLVGNGRNAQGRLRPTIFSNGNVIDLGTLGGTDGGSHDINDVGQIVGRARQALGDENRAFLYQGGVMISLGTLGGDMSVAEGINNLSQIVGVSRVGGSIYHAFLYENGQMSDLGALPGSNDSTARDINLSGAAVGHSFVGLNARATLWQDGLIYDLNDLIPLNSGWTRLDTASAINDVGQIVGSGIYNGQSHGFVLTPVPAPGVGMILLVGLGCLNRNRRRRL